MPWASVRGRRRWRVLGWLPWRCSLSCFCVEIHCGGRVEGMPRILLLAVVYTGLRATQVLPEGPPSAYSLQALVNLIHPHRALKVSCVLSDEKETGTWFRHHKVAVALVKCAVRRNKLPCAFPSSCGTVLRLHVVEGAVLTEKTLE